MAEFGLNDAENYGSQGTGNGAGFFRLSDDKECKKVRVMYEKPEDVKGYAVHEVQVNGKKRYVSCLRKYNEPVDNCPFCKAGNIVQAKYFIPLYSMDEEKVMFWERGKKFGPTISGLISRTPNLVSQVFEIERSGKKGDTNTTYQFYNIGSPDQTTLQDLPEIPKVLGGLILDKNKAECETYLATGSFPQGEGEQKQQTSYPRRTPANVGNQF